MARPVSQLAKRRRRNVVIFLLLALLLLAADASGTAALHRTTLVSGWLLFAMIVGLAIYNLRKKIPVVPLGNSATWLQVHVYVGLLSGVVFCMHLQWQLPNGLFEVVFALLYVLVFLSGVFGLVISRLFARRLTTRGGDVLFARIPRLRNQIRAEVERLVIDCMVASGSTAVAELYANRLKDFFDGPRHVWQHLILSLRPVSALTAELAWQDRYLTEAERRTMQKIAAHVRHKDDLDFHYAHQAVLKYWLFAHLPLTYVLLAFAVVHAVLVHAFSGAMW